MISRLREVRRNATQLSLISGFEKWLISDGQSFTIFTFEFVL